VCSAPSTPFSLRHKQAFPNAKVILTVREVVDWFTHIGVKPSQGIAGHQGAVSDADPEPLLQMWVWGRSYLPSLTLRHAARKLFEHNAKIIHGVPKHQLLVWDMYEDPKWETLCDFLGVPVPQGVDFPTPKPMEY
jgi:hypothetical protein